MLRKSICSSLVCAISGFTLLFHNTLHIHLGHLFTKLMCVISFNTPAVKCKLITLSPLLFHRSDRPSWLPLPAHVFGLRPRAEDPGHRIPIRRHTDVSFPPPFSPPHCLHPHSCPPALSCPALASVLSIPEDCVSQGSHGRSVKEGKKMRGRRLLLSVCQHDA